MNVAYICKLNSLLRTSALRLKRHHVSDFGARLLFAPYSNSCTRKYSELKRRHAMSLSIFRILSSVDEIQRCSVYFPSFRLYVLVTKVVDFKDIRQDNFIEVRNTTCSIRVIEVDFCVLNNLFYRYRWEQYSCIFRSGCNPIPRRDSCN